MKTWHIVAIGLLVLIAYQRGLFAGLLPASPVTYTGGDPQKNPPPNPQAGTSAIDIINAAVKGVFDVARNLTEPKTTPATT